VKRYDRIMGGLFGVACGDALGGTLEFMSKKQCIKKYGYLKDIIGGGPWELAPGEITDDTAMTIAVAKGILENPANPVDSIGHKFMEWFDSHPKDVGNTIRLALEEYGRVRDWKKASYYAHEISGGRSAGNGSLMRCLPAALYYDSEFDRMVDVTEAQSSLTHYDEKAGEACVLYNTLVYEYLKDEPKMPVIHRLLKKYPYYGRVLEICKEDLEPSGYVVDTLLCALWCFINTTSFEEAVCEAVNLCGDSDTIGAITGGLAGVYYGYEDIPDRWKDKILEGDTLKDLSCRINSANKAAVQNIVKIESNIGGYPGNCYGIEIDFEKQRAVYEQYGCGYDQEKHEVIGLSLSDLEEFMDELCRIKVFNWKNIYKSDEPLDGGSHWWVRVKTDRCTIKSQGSNDYPSYWRDFCKSIERLTSRTYC